MTAIEYHRLERAINAGEVALDRNWRSMPVDQREANLEQSGDLWAGAFLAELGPGADLTREQVARAWQVVNQWADTRDVQVPLLGWIGRLTTELALEISAPAREDVIAPVGRFPSAVVEAVARGLDPEAWERFDDPFFDVLPIHRRALVVQESLAAATTALTALEATGHLDTPADEKETTR